MAWTNDQTSTPPVSLSAVPPNGGEGFQPWNTGLTISKFASNQTGYALLNATTAGYTNLNSPSNICFSMYGHNAGSGSGSTSTYCIASRKLIEPLQDGGFYLKAKLGVNFNNGYKGIQFLRQGASIFTFTVFTPPAGTQRYFYRWANQILPWDLSVGGSTGGYSTLGWPYRADSIINVTLQYNSNLIATLFRESYNPVYEKTTPQNLIPNTTLPGREIDEIRFFVTGTNDSSIQNNLFFNSLSGFSIYRI